MAQNMSKVTCPNCQQAFGAQVEQILDVEIDPSAKARVLSSQVNMVVCPHCQSAGVLSVPFLYHDPSNELAFVFMPMETGGTEVARQQIIGALSRAVMSQLPPEQKKGYLLSPEVFLTYESLINRILDVEGVTPKMLEAQRARAGLLRDLLGAEGIEGWTPILEEKKALLDDEFFEILHINLGQAESVGYQELVDRLLTLRSHLFEVTPSGQRLSRRTKALEALREDPTRERLVQLLVDAEDEIAREALVVIGQSLLDYAFFQELTKRIEQTADSTERKRLEELRSDVMEVRQRMQEQAQRVVEARGNLLRDLTLTEQPELLLRRRIADLDEIFFGILGAEIERAESSGNTAVSERLKQIWQMTVDLVRQTVPPELLLLTRIMEAAETGEAVKLLEDNREIISPTFVELLKQTEADMRDRGSEDIADRVAEALSAAQGMLPPQEGGLVTA
jgi:hypothetical protein